MYDNELMEGAHRPNARIENMTSLQEVATTSGVLEDDRLTTFPPKKLGWEDEERTGLNQIRQNSITTHYPLWLVCLFYKVLFYLNVLFKFCLNMFQIL